MKDNKNFNEEKFFSNPDHSLNNTKIQKKGGSYRVKPKFFKMLGQIMHSHVEPIFNYLELTDLCKVRQSNKLFLAVVHEYYPKRLKFEVDIIRLQQERNYENFMDFLKIIDSQIPISNNNWLEFDLNIAIANLKILDKKVITALRGIKNIGKLSEVVFAPFCIIFGQNRNSYSMIKNEGWKKISGKILADEEFLRKLNNLDLDNLNEVDMLDAFVYLNLPELQLENIRKYSHDLEKLIIWSRAVLSYHIIIHPFTYRNEKSQIPPGSDMHYFLLNMSKMLDRFYKFKKFLIKMSIMSIPLGEYVFNLQHNREKVIEKDNKGKYLTDKQIACILSYLPYNQSHKLMSVNKKWKNSFGLAVDLVISEIIKEIFYIFLQAGQSTILQKIPILFENNIFSDYFLMIEDILNSENSPLSKEQLSDIKNIKIESELVRAVSKVACLILNEKPERKATAAGELKVLYLEKIKTMVINGLLVKNMKNVNKLDIDTANLNTIQEELIPFMLQNKLEEIKNINRGVYQLLIWELIVLEFHKNFNPFEFISNEYIINRFDKEEVEIVKYFCDVMNYLKYNLKIKYRLNSSSYLNKGFEFKKFVEELKKYLILQKMSLDMIFANSNSIQEYKKISKVYFETRDLVPPGAKPTFYERMFLEVVKLNYKLTKVFKEYGTNEISNTSNIFQIGNLGTIREENSLNMDKDISNIRTSTRFNQLMTTGNYVKEINKLNLLTQLSKNTKKPNNFSFNDLPQDLIIKQMLFFLDINSLPKFSIVNKRANESVKTHIFIRLYFLNKEKKMIEQENSELIAAVEEKRKIFYEEYEVLPPTKEHAIQLINMMSTDDIMELRQLFKKFNKNYEAIISPFVLLMGGKAQSQINPNGTKTVSYFYPAQRILNSKEFSRKVREFELETISQSRFKSVEKIIESSSYDINKIKQLSPCLHHLISWVTGVIEFHRVIRKYSLSSYDYEILNEDEINFCTEMDNILILYYRLLRYANTYCKKFEKNAQAIMASLNINSGNKLSAI